MIYSAEAERQIDELRLHYDRLNRTEAIKNLIATLIEAEAIIGSDPAVGLKAPRPYPSLAGGRRLWLKVRRYWIAYNAGPPPVILAVFYEAADIPRRI